jgi:hypothetical protein
VLQKHGFTLSSPNSAWEQFGFNTDTLILISSVSLPSGQTYVQVLATSNNKSSAEAWPNELITAIEKRHQID